MPKNENLPKVPRVAVERGDAAPPKELPALKVHSETEPLAAALVNERTGGGEEQEEPPFDQVDEGKPEPSEDYVSEPETDQQTIARLEKQLEELEGINTRRAQQLQAANAKLAEVQKQKANYSDVSRKFRIFLHIVQGFTARGLFDPDSLRQRPGAEHNIMKHAAGLAEVANKATENRF